MMMLLNIKLNMSEISAFPPEEIIEKMEKILEPFHLKWKDTGCYQVEDGFEEETMIQGAIEALHNAEWLKDAFQVQVECRLPRYLLKAINVRGMIPPAKEKMEYYRKFFAKEVLCEDCMDARNPIVLDENMKVVNGYATYLVMQEQGYEFATCIQKREISYFFH